jgi:hypothetical protein
MRDAGGQGGDADVAADRAGRVVLPGHCQFAGVCGHGHAVDLVVAQRRNVQLGQPAGLAAGGQVQEVEPDDEGL